MAIRVRESTQDDLPAIVRIAAAAFHPKTDAIAARLFPAREQEQETHKDGEAYSWRYAKKTASLYSPHTVMVVAVDDSLNDQVVGFGLWDVHSEEAANQPQSSAQEPPPASFDQEAFAELRAIVSADHKEMFGERGLKDVWHLDYLGVDPQQQRKGIGKILLDWGISQAAGEKKDCYLLATPAGKTLYAKTGFEEYLLFAIPPRQSWCRPGPWTSNLIAAADPPSPVLNVAVASSSVTEITLVAGGARSQASANAPSIDLYAKPVGCSPSLAFIPCRAGQCHQGDIKYWRSCKWDTQCCGNIVARSGIDAWTKRRVEYAKCEWDPKLESSPIRGSGAT
ncbi:hypothetical protein TARUN_6345 [Trichoderma arundinaceum]|uniref:N-acetyltransferase domain-containing protein n=1 Tax=Trichoderma arundinaceum TaxID=490622 RepID=A0A395NJ84_TRIAR|nr:hypothetical protein TARUN_6345 [Trichoderma arundinaceum]